MKKIIILLCSVIAIYLVLNTDVVKKNTRKPQERFSYFYVENKTEPFKEIDESGFYGHLLKVVYRGRWALINSLGEFIAPPVFNNPIYINTEGDFIVVSHSEKVSGSEIKYYHYYFDKALDLKFCHNHGSTVLPFSEGVGGFFDSNSFGYVNDKGKIIYKFPFNRDDKTFQKRMVDIKLTAPGRDNFGKLFLIYSEGFGLIDKNGKEIFKSIYDDIKLVSLNGKGKFASLVKDNVQKIVSDEGKQIFETAREDKINIIWNLMFVEKPDVLDLYSIKDKKLIKIKSYRMIEHASGVEFPSNYLRGISEKELIVVNEYPMIYFLNKNGEEVFKSSDFSIVYPFSEGVAIVNHYKKGLGIVDNKGNFSRFKEQDVFLYDSDSGNSFSNGLLRTRKINLEENSTKSTCVINVDGDYVVKCGESPEIIDEGEPFEIKRMYQFNNKNYMININGQTKKSLIFDAHPYLLEDNFFKDGVFPVYKNGRYGLLNMKGEAVKLKMPKHVKEKEEYLKNLIYKDSGSKTSEQK